MTEPNHIDHPGHDATPEEMVKQAVKESANRLMMESVTFKIKPFMGELPSLKFTPTKTSKRQKALRVRRGARHY